MANGSEAVVHWSYAIRCEWAEQMKSGGADLTLLVDIQVVARASREAVGPAVGERLRVAVTAPPVDGEANAAVIQALARAFGVRRNAIEIVRGLTGKKKTVRVAGATRDVLDRLMAGIPVRSARPTH